MSKFISNIPSEAGKVVSILNYGEFGVLIACEYAIFIMLPTGLKLVEYTNE